MSEADKIIKSLRDSGKKVEEFYMSNKTSDKNVGSIEEDIRILQEKDCMWHYPETRIEEAIENIIADYTRQKEMNEEHQKINEELRERVKELERGKPKMRMLNCAYSDRNEDSVYTTRFAVMQKQIDEKDKRIQELEEENLIQRKQIMNIFDNDYIPMQVVIDKMEELNKEIKSCDEIDAIFKIKQQQILQELLETK